MANIRLAGWEAVEYAERNGLLVAKHADPIEDAREDLSPEEARAIAAEDPRLIYIALRGKFLVIDGATTDHEDETADEIELVPFAALEADQKERAAWPLAVGHYQLHSIMVQDQDVIRALYDHPSAEAYGAGSYAVDL